MGATVSFFTAAADLAADRVTTPGPFLAKVLADTEVLADADPLANTLLVPAAGPFAAKPPADSFLVIESFSTKALACLLVAPVAKPFFTKALADPLLVMLVTKPFFTMVPADLILVAPVVKLADSLLLVALVALPFAEITVLFLVVQAKDTSLSDETFS